MLGDLEGSTILAKTTYTVRADPNPGDVASVNFYGEAGKLLASDATSPFTYALYSSALGPHSLKAVPYDSRNVEGTPTIANYTTVAATPSPTPSPSASPSPSPSPGTTTVTVTVLNPTAGDSYLIYYDSKPPTTSSPKVSANPSVDIPGLPTGSTYYFANTVTNTKGTSVMSQPISQVLAGAQMELLVNPQ